MDTCITCLLPQLIAYLDLQLKINKYMLFDICYPMSALASRLTADKVSIIFWCLALLSDFNLCYYKVITSVTSATS